ncbi:MAG: carbonic anhydrase [Alphaproteobacteria bacterium]|nr:carbonic anhydrase [Alphaproteobacteria bacterium]
MNKTLLLSAAMVALAGCGTATHAAGKAKWSYSGDAGPEHWGSLHASYTACSAGKNQSPINLTRFVDSALKPIGFSYKSGGREILNNGHTIQVNYAPGSKIRVDGKSFELKQFHFHAPSENTIEGHSYPLEGHFVHADAKGNLAVVAVMYKVESPLAELDKAWRHMPGRAGEKKTLPIPVHADALMPKRRGYYRFNGSLTTPPCTEGVRWLVLNTYKEISAAQVKAFTKVMHHPNNRPLQPLNARTVLE